MKRVIRRPRLIFWLVLLCFSQGAMYLTFFFLALVYAQIQHIELIFHRPVMAIPELLPWWLLIGTWLALGLASHLIAIGLRQGRSWAWTGAVVLEGAILILSLEAYFNRRANVLSYLGMTNAVVMTFLLNQREIQDFYRAHKVEIPGQEDVRPDLSAPGNADG